MTVPYTFGTATTSIPLSNLDANFNTPITLGNTSIYLGNTTTTIGNLTLTNATISSGTVNITNVTVTTANVTNITVTGTANIATGNITTLTSTSITDSGLTSGRVTFAGASGLLTDSANLKFDGNNLGVGGTLNTWTSFKCVQLTGGSLTSFLTDSIDLFQNSYYDGSYRYVGNGYATRFYSTAGTYVWSTSGASNTGGAGVAFGGFTNLMTIDASGNLGLGVTPNSSFGSSAYGALQLGQRGVLMFYKTGASILNVGTNFYYDGSAYKRLTADFVTQYQQATGEHNWRIAGTGAADSTISFTQAMTLDASGNLLVGRTSQGSYPQRLNLLQSSATEGGIQSWCDSATFTGSVITARASRNTTNNSYTFFQCSIDGVGDKLYIFDSGNVYNTTGTYGTLSDIKLKENIVDATSKLNDVMALKVRNFNLKSEPELKQIGFIAQELETIFPSMVEETLDQTKIVKTTVLIPILVKAIQEQQALIESLTTRLTALENK
jgi:hypothetical protein